MCQYKLICVIRRKQVVFAQEFRAQTPNCTLLFYCRMQSDGNKGRGKESEARVTGENSKRSPPKLAVVSQDNAAGYSVAGDVFREVVQKHTVLEESSGEEGRGIYLPVSSCLSQVTALAVKHECSTLLGRMFFFVTLDNQSKALAWVSSC